MHTPCEKKRAFRSQAKARQHLRYIKSVAAALGLKKPTEVYECRNCGQWHLTTTPKREAAS